MDLSKTSDNVIGLHSIIDSFIKCNLDVTIIVQMSSWLKLSYLKLSICQNFHFEVFFFFIFVLEKKIKITTPPPEVGHRDYLLYQHSGL